MVRPLYTTGCLGVSMRETVDNPTNTSLAMTPGLTFLLMVRPQIGEAAGQLMRSKNPSTLLSENPSIIGQMLNAVYLNPKLMEPRGGLKPNPKYEDIRSDYQRIIEFLSDAYMDGVISTYASFGQRVKGQMELLQNQFGGEQVRIIEVVLMFLIEDGAQNLTGVNDYLDIKASHLVYQELAKEVFEKGKKPTLSAKEEQDFVHIGQELLKTTMLFEVKLQEVGQVSTHPNREKHFDGLIADARFLQLSIRALQNAPQNESGMVGKQIDLLKDNLRQVKDRLQLEFPDRYPLLNKLLGQDADEVLGKKSRRWARHPGEPEFSIAESTGFLHLNE